MVRKITNNVFNVSNGTSSSITIEENGYYFPLLEELLPKDEYIWVEKEVNRSSANGGNNSESKGKAEKGIELLIMNYNPETGKKL
jgi:hypothetical protein